MYMFYRLPHFTLDSNRGTAKTRENTQKWLQNFSVDAIVRF